MPPGKPSFARRIGRSLYTSLDPDLVQHYDIQPGDLLAKSFVKHGDHFTVTYYPRRDTAPHAKTRARIQTVLQINPSFWKDGKIKDVSKPLIFDLICPPHATKAARSALQTLIDEVIRETTQ